jgi:hypothetical protein
MIGTEENTCRQVFLYLFGCLLLFFFAFDNSQRKFEEFALNRRHKDD